VNSSSSALVDVRVSRALPRLVARSRTVRSQAQGWKRSSLPQLPVSVQLRAPR